jgi:hypothetical protein
MVTKVEQEMNFIKLLTHDLLSLNFPLSDYMLIPSFTDPYDYHVMIHLNLQCVKPELIANTAEFDVLGSMILVMQGKKGLSIKISIHKGRVDTLPAIVKYLLKLIHVLCYERPS